MHTASRRARTPLTALLLVGAVLALLLGGAGPASAHAALSDCDPADTAVLKTAPTQVTLTFTEAVSLSDGSLRVLSPKNERVNDGPVRRADGRSNTAQVPLSDDLSDGTYTVAWRVVSADSHPIAGAFTFSIGEPSATTAEVADGSPDDTPLSRLYGVFRYIAYSGLALLIGVAVLVVVCRPAGAALRRLRVLLVGGWAALFASTAVLLLLRGPYETGEGIGAVADLSLLGRTATGRTGTSLLTRLVLLAVAAVLLGLFRSRLRRRRTAERAAGAGDLFPTGRPVALPVALFSVALALTWAAAEHASAGIQVPVAIPVSVLHLLAMAVWLGGLTALTAVLFRAPAGPTLPAAALARFSRLAFAAVTVLVVTGVYQSWRQVGSWSALTDTDYGRLLVLKVGAVVVVLGAAAFSRRWTADLGRAQGSEALAEVEPRVRVRVPENVGASSGEGVAQGGGDGDAGGGGVAEPRPPSGPVVDSDRHRRRLRGLRRSVAVEAVIGAVVLVITTMLTGTQPSRAAAATGGGAGVTGLRQPPARVVTVPFDMGKPNSDGKVQLTFEPGTVGENVVEALVFGPDQGVATVPELRLTLTHRAQRIGPLDAKLVDQGGYWSTDSLRLPLPGTWTLRLTVRTTEIDQVTVTENVDIRPLPD
ncbi:copper resistance CopC/CopD family protein [Streptomyces brasiliscabiei]|uniref:copper resistance CopC/CopD family protein n=1 Tax=Streptomyces brasiliscabiei TaxID=2736302 RepID=UPI001C0FEAC5|nr:copper resistance protein CopC [Streptomyces brasiliscabiei]